MLKGIRPKLRNQRSYVEAVKALLLSRCQGEMGVFTTMKTPSQALSGNEDGRSLIPHGH